MAPHSSRYLLGWALLCCIVTAVTSTTRTLCLTCSYVYTGHDVGRECISTPYQGRHVNTSCLYGCITIAVYTADYERLNSLTRGCRTTAANEPEADSVDCQNPGGGPRCQQICFTDHCNDGDGDLHDRLQPPGTGDGVASLDLQMALWLLTGGAVLLSCL